MKLEVHNLNSYYGRAHILFDVSLKADAGEVVALLGRNGAGKSTTLRSIVGLVPERRSETTFEGVDISDWPAHRVVRRGIGYVPEDRRIFTRLTVQENLLVGRYPVRKHGSPWTLERLFGLFPNLAEILYRSANRISGGEQQMLTIARTLMGDPRLIMLDEPSEGLAPKIVEQMAQAILEMRRAGLSVLLSEQNLHFARMIADRVYIIEKGRIRFSGSMTELEADEHARHTYLSV